jgi:hypothetical protein
MRRWLAMILTALALAGCASTRLDAQWTSPEIAGRRIEGKVLVVALTRDETVRRLYEDEMAARLAARGVAPIRSYTVLAGPLTADASAAVLAAARGAGATAVLSSALLGQERAQRVIVEPLPAWAWGYGGWFDHYWSFAYTRTEVRTFERYVAGTSLTDVASGKLLWTARTHTDAPANIEREIRAFAAVIVDALSAAGLL